MIDFIKILQTQDLTILSKEASIEVLENHWIKLYDDFWTLTNDNFAKLILRKQNELLIKKTRLNILYTIHNGLVSLAKIEQTEKVLSQRKQLIDIYENQTKNKVNLSIGYVDLVLKVQSSISNFENNIEKLEREIKNTGEKEVVSGFDLIATVSVELGITLNFKETTVAEYASYKKLAKQKQQAQANGK